MSRFARDRRVFFIEEPLFDAREPELRIATCPQTGVYVVTPHLNERAEKERNQVLEKLLTDFAVSMRIQRPIVWFYTPMALEFLPSTISPAAVVYDCMDELSLFKGAPSRMRILEEKLMRKADLVFTGGISLFEAKRQFHLRVHAFPSGVDVAHFVKARALPGDFGEQSGLPHPRLGYAGVIDERLDLHLLDEAARRRPEWRFIMLGPTAKVSPDSLPRRPNIHWLGMKNYADLPKYFAGWDVGIMPFALNDATRFISPTKTPEYLAAGLPVVSTAIRDVVRTYGDVGLARIVHSPEDFIQAAEQSIAVDMSLKWRERADAFLRTLSWDSVWAGMNELILGILHSEASAAAAVAGTAHPSQGTTARV